MNIKAQITKDIYQWMNGSIEEANIIVEFPKSPEMGDYSIPCFRFAKEMKKSPVEIANLLKEGLQDSIYEKVEIVGGYLNIFVNKVKLAEYVINEIMIQKENYGNSQIGAQKKIVLDYSAPNIAKPFGVGHLRSTVIGNALKNIYQKTGYETVSINYLGDTGTQFGKLIYAYLTWGDKELVEANPVSELVKLYIRFHEESKENSELDEEGRRYFKMLEDGDPEIVALWKWFRKESLLEFNKTYDLLGINEFDSYNGESYYNDKMDAVVEELIKKELLVESQGAMVVHLGEEIAPALIKRSDGASLYITRDLAAAFDRKQTYHFDEAVYVVGNEQTLHFEQLKKVISKMGYDWANNIHHINFGLVLQDGKKMSTRAGKTVKLHDVLLEAVALASEYIEQRTPDLENKELVAKEVGVGAVIFNDLKNYRTNDIDFNLTDILKFEGETGPYLQYTYARIGSLLKNQTNVVVNVEKMEIPSYIWNIIFKLYQFSDEILRAKEGNDPSIIAKYLLELAQGFNKFYANEKIIDGDLEKTGFKLQICSCMGAVIKEGLRLLGVSAPQKM